MKSQFMFNIISFCFGMLFSCGCHIQGPAGPQGEIGPRGKQGLQGKQGIQGQKGDPGKSYSPNVDNCFNNNQVIRFDRSRNMQSYVEKGGVRYVPNPVILFSPRFCNGRKGFFELIEVQAEFIRPLKEFAKIQIVWHEHFMGRISKSVKGCSGTILPGQDFVKFSCLYDYEEQANHKLCKQAYSSGKTCRVTAEASILITEKEQIQLGAQTSFIKKGFLHWQVMP